MGQYALQCLVCGKPFIISKRAAKAFYCSDACNHRAWRARRKARQAEEARQLDWASWEIYQHIISIRPDLDSDLSTFFVDHKKQALVDLLAILAKVVGFEVIAPTE